MDEPTFEEYQKRFKETKEELTKLFYEIKDLTSFKDEPVGHDLGNHASLADCIFILAKAVKELKADVEELKKEREVI